MDDVGGSETSSSATRDTSSARAKSDSGGGGDDNEAKTKKVPKQIFYAPDLYTTVALADDDTIMAIVNSLCVAGTAARAGSVHSASRRCKKFKFWDHDKCVVFATMPNGGRRRRALTNRALTHVDGQTRSVSRARRNWARRMARCFSKCASKSRTSVAPSCPSLRQRPKRAKQHRCPAVGWSASTRVHADARRRCQRTRTRTWTQSRSRRSQRSRRRRSWRRWRRRRWSESQRRKTVRAIVAYAFVGARLTLLQARGGQGGQRAGRDGTLCDATVCDTFLAGAVAGRRQSQLRGARGRNAAASGGVCWSRGTSCGGRWAPLLSCSVCRLWWRNC